VEPPVACDPVATTSEVVAARVTVTAERRRKIRGENDFTFSKSGSSPQLHKEYLEEFFWGSFRSFESTEGPHLARGTFVEN
jgi:hypothetical protein